MKMFDGLKLAAAQGEIVSHSVEVTPTVCEARPHRRRGLSEADDYRYHRVTVIGADSPYSATTFIL